MYPATRRDSSLLFQENLYSLPLLQFHSEWFANGNKQKRRNLDILTSWCPRVPFLFVLCLELYMVRTYIWYPSSSAIYLLYTYIDSYTIQILFLSARAREWWKPVVLLMSCVNFESKVFYWASKMGDAVEMQAPSAVFSFSTIKVYIWEWLCIFVSVFSIWAAQQHPADGKALIQFVCRHVHFSNDSLVVFFLYVLFGVYLFWIFYALLDIVYFCPPMNVSRISNAISFVVHKNHLRYGKDNSIYVWCPSENTGFVVLGRFKFNQFYSSRQ